MSFFLLKAAIDEKLVHSQPMDDEIEHYKSLPSSERPWIEIIHDDSACDANDGQSMEWVEQGNVGTMVADIGFAGLATSSFDNLRYNEAVSGPMALDWKKAIATELKAMDDHKVFTFADLPPGRKAIGFKWVFSIKFESDGSIERHKARLCAQGFSQVPGLDYRETFAPVARFTSVRVLLSIAAARDYELHHFDVSTAFLHGHLEEKVYMKVPDGIVAPAGKVLHLHKAIYGIKQASRAWNLDLHMTLTRLGFSRSPYDPCVYVRDDDHVFCAMAVIVDDLIIACSDENYTQLLYKDLSKCYKIKDKGGLRWCLNMLVERDRKNRTLSLSQESFAKRLLARFGMLDCNPCHLPALEKVYLSIRDCVTDNSKRSFLHSDYRTGVGSLLYLASTTRPDLSFSVSCLSRFLNSPGEAHYNAMKKTLRYIQGTKDMKLTFSGGELLSGYCDSDWANNGDNRRSQFGWLFKVGRGTVSYMSKLCKTVSTSTLMAEYIAASEASKEVVWLQGLLKSLTPESSTPSTTKLHIGTDLHIDNSGAIRLGTNPSLHNRSKHIDIRYHYIRELVADQTIMLRKIDSNHNIADILTKPLGRVKFNYFRKPLLNS